MTDQMTIKNRDYLKSHPWLSFTLDLSRASVPFWLVLGECQSKCEHISGVPLRPDIAAVLHSVYLAKGVWGTTAIEGNTLSEEDVRKHLEGKLDVSPDKEYQKVEVDNILKESNRMLEIIASGGTLTLSAARIKEINGLVLHGLSLGEGITPGDVRKYSVGVMNYRGAPWQDCGYLFARLCEWLNGPDFEPRAGLSKAHMVIVKAVVAHLYIEWIHGFGDGNGRTGRMVEVQILLSAGIPSPACHLLSNHYNQTRKEYLSQLNAASQSGGNPMPFLSYALNGLLAGLKEQLSYIRKLQMENAWLNYIHDVYRNQSTPASRRQKNLVLDLYGKQSPVLISDLDQISPRLAKAYANMNPRTISRDVDALLEKGLLIREGKSVRANQNLIAAFLPVKAIF